MSGLGLISVTAKIVGLTSKPANIDAQWFRCKVYPTDEFRANQAALFEIMHQGDGIQVSRPPSEVVYLYNQQLDMGHTVTAVETVKEEGDTISYDVPNSLLTADYWV